LYRAFLGLDLRTRILSGEWEPGAGLSRMTDLARRYEVNRDTLARAIARGSRPPGAPGHRPTDLHVKRLSHSTHAGGPARASN
jgi:DNA-binding transcriptional MocR family regulator